MSLRNHEPKEDAMSVQVYIPTPFRRATNNQDRLSLEASDVEALLDELEEAFGALKGPIIRITTPHVPLPSADQLEDAVVPTVARIVAEVKRGLGRGA